MNKKTKYPFGKPLLDTNEYISVTKVLKSNILVHGYKSKEFESLFKKFTKSKEAISVSSCTAGMHLTYFCLGIKKGDEVIVPAQTHISTAHAVELKALEISTSQNLKKTLIKELKQLQLFTF